jgi:hypothetical protein
MTIDNPSSHILLIIEANLMWVSCAEYSGGGGGITVACSILSVHELVFSHSS